MTETSAGEQWLASAEADARRDPATMSRAFALAARKVGRGPVRPDTDPAGVVHGAVEDAARARLVRALVGAHGDGAAPVLAELYGRGDSAERRGVLRGLDAVVEHGDGHGDDVPPAVATVGVELAQDALRANELALVAAAMGPFGSSHLDAHDWRHAVLKLVFMGISLDAVWGLDARRDDELARMARDFAAERRAAGRPVPADISRLTSERSA
ncbi:EboA domain-containing protein [Demequina sp. NBRC 110053]|uniref:EboA domain-containing protein n=1 Tax=Demequina sp. NBRC 110053 TaxID=1570342 RepID=UPI00190E955D|nr:EboA domain-containing protein [Demequina sp. NBRC 110053]